MSTEGASGEAQVAADPLAAVLAEPTDAHSAAGVFPQHRRTRRGGLRSTHRKLHPRRWPIVVGAILVAAIVATLLTIAPWDPYRIQFYRDEYTALTKPSPQKVVAIADRTGMSGEGRLIYLASTPAIELSKDFNVDCAVETGGTLGCFDGSDIYVYSVTDARLQGTVEVTAAHEMLHAAYQRMTPADRKAVDKLISAYIATLPQDDPTFTTLDDGYQKAQFIDEWHSRLGTEYADLPPALEAHYAKYFDDRSKVLTLYKGSVALLDLFEKKLQALSDQLDALDKALKPRVASYDAAVAQLNADISSFNARADNGGFSSQGQFNRERAALQSRVDALIAETNAINAQITHYNDLVDQLVKLDDHYSELYQHLDSTNPPEGSN